MPQRPTGRTMRASNFGRERVARIEMAGSEVTSACGCSTIISTLLVEIIESID
jgi:hypothetical protein